MPIYLKLVMYRIFSYESAEFRREKCGCECLKKNKENKKKYTIKNIKKSRTFEF